MYYLSFSMFLLHFYILSLFITNSHNPGVFCSSCVPHSGFSTIHFPLCTGLSPMKSRNPWAFEKYAPQQQSSISAFPESLFHFCIKVNRGILYVLSRPCSQHAQQPPSTVFFRANMIDSPLVGSISSLKMLLFCTSGVRYCFFICIYSC